MTETSINFVHGDDYAIWASDNAAVMRKMEELMKETECEIVKDTRGSEDEYLEIKIPKECFRLPKSKKKREISEERREEMKENLKRAREKRMNG